MTDPNFFITCPTKSENKQQIRTVATIFCTLEGTALAQACLTFYVERAKLKIFGLHACNMEFKTQNDELIGISLNIYVILPVYFSINHVQLIFASIIIGKYYKQIFNNIIRIL